MTAVIERPSPNHDARGDVPVDMLVLHYTGMERCADALDRLTDPEAKVSAHWLVDEDGTVYALVPEDRRAWHAGVAHWRGHDDVNARSVGVELHNPGHEFGYRAFPEAQMAALIPLCLDILARHPIPARNVVGHSDVAPARKQDPGERFDWARLAAAGIGLWPGPVAATPRDPGIDELQTRLAVYGYGLRGTGALDAPTRAVLAAFQRHFRPSAVTGEPDAETVAILCALGKLTSA